MTKAELALREQQKEQERNDQAKNELERRLNLRSDIILKAIGSVEITNDNVRNAVLLYRSLLETSELYSVDKEIAARSAGFAVYAFLNGDGNFIIDDKKSLGEYK